MLKTIFTPETIKKANSKIALAKTVKVLKTKMLKFHTTAETACSFYLNLEYKFAEGDVEPLLLLGKMDKWKNIAKKDTTDSSTAMSCLRGAAFVRLNSEGLPEALVLMPVKGKAKETPITKAMRPMLKKLGIELLFEAGMSEDQLEALQAKEDAAPDMPDDELEEGGDELEEEGTPAPQGADVAAQLTQLRNAMIKSITDSNIVKATSVNPSLIETAKQLQGQFQQFKTLLATAAPAEQQKHQAFVNQLNAVEGRVNQILKLAGANPAPQSNNKEEIQKAAQRNTQIFKEISALVKELGAVLSGKPQS
jgi:hypothetical protein